MAIYMNMKLYWAIHVIENVLPKLWDDYIQSIKNNGEWVEYVHTGFENAEHFKEDIYSFLNDKGFEWKKGHKWVPKRTY